MACEIEIKAHIPSVTAMYAIIEARFPAAAYREYDKQDTYFSSPQNPSMTEFRLREQSGSFLVTRKFKQLDGNIEINDEIEFTVDNPEAFRRFACTTGYQEAITKRKRGRAYVLDGVLAEVSQVDGLGPFIELEILLDAALPESVAIAKQRLLRLLARLDVPEKAIETRRYTEMLMQRS